MKTNNRRNFLKSSLVALTGAPLIASSLKAGDNTGQIQNNKPLVTRVLGKTGIKIPVISMGTGDCDNPRIIEAALEKGIILLATSQYYGNGNNEKMLGELLKGRKRESFLVATSAMPDGIDHKAGMFTNETNAEAFLKKFESSLERLNTDYVDIFFLPFAAKRETVFFEPILKAMGKIKKDGKARFIGIATHKFEDEAIRAAVETKLYDVIMTQYNFRRKNAMEIKSAVDYAAGEGMGIIAMKTMAGAYWDKERTMPVNTKAALKWVLQNKNIHTTVPGITTFDQLQQNIDLMDNLELTEDETKSLQPPVSLNVNGLFCQQCGECIPQCPKGMDIPTIMRGFMYAYGYRNLKHASQTLEYANLDEKSCNDCSSCKVHCVMGFDVKSKIQDVARIKYIPSEFLHG